MHQIKLLPRVVCRTFGTRLLSKLCWCMFVWVVLMIQVTKSNHQHKHRFCDHHHRKFTEDFRPSPDVFRRLVKYPRSLPDQQQSTTYDQLPPFVETSSTNQDDQDDQQFQRPLSPPIRIIDFTSTINADDPDTVNETSFNINDQRQPEPDVNPGVDNDVDNGQIIGEDDPSIIDITYEDRHCPRDREEAKARGQSCLRKCNSHKDCISSKRRCLCDGLCGWSCIRPDLNCEELPNIPNSRYTLTNGNFFHSKLIYECDPGYILSGQRERLCQGDGSWSGWQPQCKSKPVCGPPPFIPHSKHPELIGTEFELNKTIQYECFNGYEPNGSTEAICVHRNDTVFWSIDLVCVRKNCGDPGHIENGYRKISGYVFTSSVNYFCNDGYILAGRAIRYCQSDGHWGGELPVCKPVKCNQPEDPQNGRAFYDNYTYGSVVTYQCKTNYKLYGPNNRTCQSNREWSGEEPECKIIDCGQPESFPNGYIEIQSTTIGSSIYFFCFDGMIFDGQHANATCLSNGSWYPYPFPKCLAPCTVPKIQNGHVDQTTMRSKIPHGQAINVTCIENYDLQYQSTHIVCYNGSWSQTPACVPARCKKLPLRPKNGFVVAPKTDHGMRALFICHDGFTLDGSNFTFCHFGVWNISSPICNPIYCPFPGFLENGKIMLVGHMGTYDYRPYIKHVTNNRQITYECDRGYHIIEGPPGATCIAGQWSPTKLPRCELFSHPKLSRWNRSIKTMMRFNYNNEQGAEEALSGSYNKSNRISSSSSGSHEPITHKLTTSEHLSSAHHRKKRHHSKPPCIGLPTKPSMQITVARLVTNNGNKSQENITTYAHGTRIRLACDDGFVLTNPNRTLIKCAKGRWKPELPDCVPAPCLTPTVANAKFHLHRRLLMPGELVKHDQRIELLCDEGYQQQSQPLLSLVNVTLRCSFGSWMDTVSSGEEVCVPKPCKLPKRGRLTNGSYKWETTNVGEATRSPIVWVDHESWIPFECNPGFRPNQSGQYRCMFGRFEPEPPRCVEEVTSNGLNGQQDASIKDLGSDNPNTGRCRSPEKIENALLYFDQFLSEKLTLIGLAQFDQKQSTEQHPNSGQSGAQRLDYRFVQQHQPMPFEYEHGTEIVFRCVTYAQHYALQQQQQHILTNQESSNQTTSTKRSTWIIRCDNGNWIGQSFECEKDFAERLEPEERQELSLITGEDLPQTNHLFPQVDIVEQLFDHSFPGLNKSCVIETNDTNLRMYLIHPGGGQSDPADLTELELKNGSSVPNGITIQLTCVDIGRFQLIGPSSLQCCDGVWSRSGPFYCAGLSQEYNNSLDKPPTILFRNQLGPIGQSIYGKLIVYPGTILHLDCLWQRRYGTPQWSWKLAKRHYLQYWTTDSSLEYRLTIFHAQDSDSGIYTCQTPNLHIHSVEIKVESVHCPDLNLTIADIDATPTSSTTSNTTILNETSLTTMMETATTTMLPPLLPKKLTKFQSIHGSILRVVEISGTGVDPSNPSHYNRMGTLVKFQCDLGTTLVGADSIECSPESLWSAKIPKCNVTECYDLSGNLTEIVERMNKIQQQQRLTQQVNPMSSGQSTSRLEPAQIVEMNRTIGAKVIFTCPRGYGLQGTNHELECLVTGDWSGSIPYCQEVRCGEPMIPKNGYIEGISMDQLNVYYAGDIVQYACDDGYMIDGNPISICQENGRWSGPITKCKPSCPYPGLMHGLRLVSEVKFFYEINETIRFECFDGTIMKGNALIKCVASGRWSGPIPDCIPLFQDNPENVQFFKGNDDSIEEDNV